MHLIKYIKIIVGAAFVALTLISCKPTEKNYKSAYDAAQRKRDEAVREQMIPSTGMMSMDGPQLRVVNGDSVYVLRERLRTAVGKVLPSPWVVAVGVYKMDTNANASVESLKAKGWENAMVARGPGSKYYAIAAEAPTLEIAAESAAKFKKTFPDYPFIGLPGAPVLVAR